MRSLLHAGLLALISCSITLAQSTRQDSLVITGQVLDDRGHPVSGAVVNAEPEAGLRGRVPSAVSDARGQFSIVVSGAGRFMVTASKLADAYPSSANPFYYPTEEAVAHVLVGDNQAAAPFATIRLGPKAGTLAGRVLDAATGRPVEGFHILFCSAERPKFCYRPASKYPGGRFNVLVPAAPFTIQVSASGYKDSFAADRVDRQPGPLQVDSGATKVINVSLEKLPADGGAADPTVLEAPQPLSPVDGAEFSHYPRTTKLEWSAVSRAASYTVELEVCRPVRADGKECDDSRLLQMRVNPPLSGIEGTSYEFRFIGAQAGRWRVWAADAEGRVGLKSAWSKFIYRQ